MKCLHFSVPDTPQLRELLQRLPQPLKIEGFGDGHLACHQILEPVARNLAESDIGARAAGKYAAAVHFILDRLCDDSRVQEVLGEYYGLRLLVTELGISLESQADTRMTGENRFRRVARKLLRELNQPVSVSESTGSEHPAESELSGRQVAAI